MNDRTFHLTALAISSAPGRRGIGELLEGGADPEAAFKELERIAPLETQEFIAERYSQKPLEAAEEILGNCRRSGIDAIDILHHEYPALLREIKNPPLVLFRCGPWSRFPCFSIVGTRTADPLAARTARRFASDIASSGFAIVSGMAIGIDREAHLGALESRGATVGILANGIDIVYPSRNRDLFAAIAASGTSCLISEYPPGITAGKWTFVRRNRIISGLSRGTLVVKAGDKSGALITASFAAEQGREVFACPGPALDRGYAGCHRLIKSGAALAASPEDVLLELGAPLAGTSFGPLKRGSESDACDTWKDTCPAAAAGPVPGGRPPYEPEGLERKILELVRPSAGIDDIIRALGLPAGEVHQALNMLEIEGLLTKTGTSVIRSG